MADERIKTRRYDFDGWGDMELENMPDSPDETFNDWMDAALDSDETEPNAFSLATIGEDGFPKNRILYIRDIIDSCPVFYTNYESDKGRQMAKNDHVSMQFFWASLHKQVRIEGHVKKVAPEVSDAYFASRPRASQIGAWASHQSAELSSRDDLEKRIIEITERFEGSEVPRPDFWGGYIVEPMYYEFWLGKASRLHERVCYKKENEKWIKTRRNP